MGIFLKDSIRIHYAIPNDHVKEQTAYNMINREMPSSLPGSDLAIFGIGSQNEGVDIKGCLNSQVMSICSNLKQRRIPNKDTKAGSLVPCMRIDVYAGHSF